MKITDIEKIKKFKNDFWINLFTIQMNRKGKPFNKEYFDNILADNEISDKFKSLTKEFVKKYFPNENEEYDLLLIPEFKHFRNYLESKSI